MEKLTEKKIEKMKVAIYSIHSDYKKLSSDFEKLKNLVTECLQNENIEHHGMDIFNLIMDIVIMIFLCGVKNNEKII